MEVEVELEVTTERSFKLRSKKLAERIGDTSPSSSPARHSLSLDSLSLNLLSTEALPLPFTSPHKALAAPQAKLNLRPETRRHPATPPVASSDSHKGTSQSGEHSGWQTKRAKGAWPDAEKVYAQLQVDNPFDQMYQQAAFCHEVIILSQQMIPLYHLAYADVLYTMGGLENLQAAKKQYASAINLTGGKNTRALYGICLCSVAINQLTKGRNKDEKENADLQPFAAETIAQRSPEEKKRKQTLVT